MRIPALILKQLYTFGSLENVPQGVRFGIKNRLSDATLLRLESVRVDDRVLEPDELSLEFGERGAVPASRLTPGDPIPFPLRAAVHIVARGVTLEPGPHEIHISFEADPFGILAFTVKDTIAEDKPARPVIPYDKDNDYSPEIIAQRRRFIERETGKPLNHITVHSLDPETVRGNVENFTGVAQVPIGFAGPLRVNGEHAKGDFLIPLATTEGTLVASYNRGMKVLNLAGGVTCTVQADCMQRAPVFVFESAREARGFRDWVEQNIHHIREAAESTSSVAKLLVIDTYLSNKFAYLRFNFSTGDAAGQNMVGRATFAACSWILEQVPSVRRFYLESNLATDKKHSQINIMRTRGKRVTAEAVLPRAVLQEVVRVEPESLAYHWGVASLGAFLSGANNNGAHSINGITAMFIATGQDVANVSESSAGIVYAEMTPTDDLYLSLTIPSLIVASYGGGTGLATQRECLEAMDCWGPGRVNKLAEIIAGVALAGEISLAGAISSLEWVSSHEKFGRNR